MSEVVIKNCRVDKNNDGSIAISPIDPNLDVKIEGNIFDPNLELVIGDEISIVHNNIFDPKNED